MHSKENSVMSHASFELFFKTSRGKLQEAKCLTCHQNSSQRVAFFVLTTS